MRGGSEVDDLHSVRLTIWVEKHDVLGLQVGVNQAQLLQFKERGENLLSYWPDVLEGQRLELVLFEEVVEVLLQHLEDKTGVILVCEALVGADEIELVRVLLRQSRQDGDLDLSLPRVGWMVLENLDGNDLIGAFLPALGHLAEGATAQELQYLILIVEGRVQDLVLHIQRDGC